MNWHMVISGLIVVVLKVAGMTLFLLYFPQIFSRSNNGVVPTESSGTGSYTPACPRGWIPHQRRCFLLSTAELPWQESKDACEAEGSALAVVNTPEKLTFLQDITGAEKYFIGLRYKPEEKSWRWINNSPFQGNITNHSQNFNCATMGLTKTFDSAFCETSYRWICEKKAK
ncbi:C-type lectin domain family 5 member A [Rhynchocyon petersi]